MSQPTRSGKKRPDRRFDKTQLHADHHGRAVHRDYAAHFFRWGWVARQIKRGDRILDVGCGQEAPLASVLSGNMSTVPECYVGVDLNKPSIKFPPINAGWATYWFETSFMDRWEDVTVANDYTRSLGFNVIVCCEVIEHMEVADGLKLLQTFNKCLAEDGRIYLSTPVFNGKAALNHIHEYEIKELYHLIFDAGFKVERRFGTFMSAHDVKKYASETELELFDQLKEYYSGEVLATFLAPLYPDQSRNNLWVLKK